MSTTNDTQIASRLALEQIGDNALFVLVGETAAERAELARWLRAARPGRADQIAHVDTAREDETRHDGLAMLQAAPPSMLVAPLGIARAPEDEHAPWTHKFGSVIRAPRRESRRARAIARSPESFLRFVGEPATVGRLRARFTALGEDADDAARFADFVARQSVVTVERERRKTPGARVKLPRMVVPAIMARADFRAELAAIATATGRTVAEVERDARACLIELAPAPDATFVSIMRWMARTICSLGYDPKMVYDEARAKEIDAIVRTRPTAFLFTHKTHVDGLAMINFAFERELPLLHVIGGINMAVAGIGTVAKKSGAVFIRRSFQDDPVYKASIRYYLSYVMEKRFPLAWSLEGTRSRLGKLMPPRFGILKYVLEAAQRRGIDDLQIIPVSIHYDLIPEIASYETEQTGAPKTKESLAWFLGYFAGMRKPLGRMFMEFGAPVTITASEAAQAGAGDQISLDLKKIAFEAAVATNLATPLTASGAISFVMMSAAPQALTDQEITRELLAIRDFAAARGARMTHDFEDANVENVRAVARAMIDVGVLARHEDGVETVYSVAPGQQFTASYYRNTVVHLFVTNALIELALADAMDSAPGASEADFWRALFALRDLFKFEFFYSPAETFRAEAMAELDRLSENWRLRINAGGTAMGDMLKRLSPLFSPGVLKPIVDAYAVVADALLRLKQGDSTDEKDVVALCLKLGREAVLRQKIAGSESIAKYLYANGFNLAQQRGLIDGDTASLAGGRLAFAREMKAIQARIRLIESIASGRRAAHELGLNVIEPIPAPRASQGTTP